MNLEELKRLNAEPENQEAEETPAEDFLNDEDAAEETETEDLNLGEDEDSEGEEETVETWMQGDEQTSHSDAVPVKKHAALRQRLKGEINERDEQIESLKAEIEALKHQPTTEPTGKPKREDYYDAEDPDEAYADALMEWKFEQRQSKANQESQAKAQREQVEQFKAQVEEGLSGHYQRAEDLLAKHKIDHARFESAEKGFRQAIDGAMPGKGDQLTDVLISQIGEGSEKLMMYVGGSKDRKDALQAAFATDPSGLKAMRLIGNWEAQIKQPTQKKTRAPAPAKTADGDSNAKAGNDEKKLKAAYAKAHKEGNAQKAFDLRMQARSAGFNPNKW